MNVAPLIDRVTAQCPRFMIVGGAAEFGAINVAPPATPAVYLIEEASRAEPNDLVGLVRQDEVVDFGVYFAVRNVSDATGGAGAADLDVLRQEIWHALAGWVPAGCNRPVEYRAGGLVSFQSGLVWWRESYQTGRELSQ